MKILGGGFARRCPPAAALLALAAAVSPALLALPAPADRLACWPGQDEVRLEGQRAIRSAKPGNDDYLPFPYPTTDAEVAADYAQQVEY
ncbi:MAG: hypothetical protein ABI609_12860 [Acidobacteriota bacterium]